VIQFQFEAGSLPPFEYSPLPLNHTRLINIKDAVQEEPLQLSLEDVSLDHLTSSNSQRTIASENVIPDGPVNPLLQQQSTESAFPEPQPSAVPVAEGEVKELTKDLQEVVISPEAKEEAKEEAPPFDSGYTALSYCWGNDLPDISISINGFAFKITKNLHQALLSLRQRHRYKQIWIDAICINQSDLEEKNMHIREMGMIYASAALVFVWLGEEDEEPAWAIQTISQLCDYENSEKDDDRPYSTEVDTFLDAKQVSALNAFYNRPWFKRLWIVQEYFLSKDAVLACGAKSIPRGCLVNATSWIARGAHPKCKMKHRGFSSMSFSNHHREHRDERRSLGNLM
jgi:hypothetical protein